MTLPDFDALREGRSDCPSDFALDRLLGGALPDAEADTLHAHTGGCEVCLERLATRRAGFDAIPEADEGALLRSLLARNEVSETVVGRLLSWLTGSAWFAIPVTLAAAAAALVLLLPAEMTEPPLEGDTVRMKGAPVLHVYRLRAGHSEEAISGDRFTPGERLRFVVDLPAEGRVRIVGVEGSGAVYTAWPLEPEAKMERPAGDGQKLPGAVKLDQAPGREVLYLVHCPTGAGPPTCIAHGADERPECPPG